MSNPLISDMSAQVMPQNQIQNLKKISQLLKMGNPELIAQTLMMQNPQFRAFVQANQGKSAEQVAQEYGIDLSALMKQI